MDSYHFTHQEGQWKLTRAGAERAALVFGEQTKEAALEAAIAYMIRATTAARARMGAADWA
jgi:hypothetical protein